MTIRALIAALALAVVAGGHPAPAQADQLSAATRGRASPPPAFLAFCSRHPSECARSGPATRSVQLTPDRLRELQEVNSHVNWTISEMSDMDHHGREDVWSIPTDGRGDCEDFALLKRKLLIQRGWPSAALLMTVVATASGEGHAVLTVVTSSGDLILDNKTSRVALWSQTGYLFFTRLSQDNPRLWVAIGSGNARSTAATQRASASPLAGRIGSRH
jgi:predicted transglutaminase-like cysteine proteinase